MTTQASGALAPLTFHDTTFTVIERNGEIWFKASEIAQALGYKNEDAVSRIYRRNADEFTDRMTQTIDANSLKVGKVNLTAPENKELAIRIFSLRGAHLVAIFSRTLVAKAFRVWVLDILDRHVKTPPPPPATNQLEIFKQLVRTLEEQERRVSTLERTPMVTTCPAGLPLLTR